LRRSAAPTTQTVLTATSIATSVARSLPADALLAEVVTDDRSTSTAAMRVDLIAGNNPINSPLMKVIANVKATTVPLSATSSRRGTPGGAYWRSSSTRPAPIVKPTMPATAASRQLSAST